LADLKQNLHAGLRLALFRRVPVRAFRVSLGQAVALILLSVALEFVVDLARAGLDARFNVFAIPHAAFGVILGFVAWYAVAMVYGRERQVLPLLVMTGAVAPVFYLAQLLLALAGVQSFAGYGWSGFVAYWVLFGAFLVVVFRILAKVLRRGWIAHGVGTAGYALLTVAPLYLVPFQYFWLPDYDPDRGARRPTVNAEEVFYAQPELLAREQRRLKRQRPGVTDVYFVGFGSYAYEDVFMKEIRAIRELFDTRFDSAGRSVALINNPATAADTPIASATNLGRTLRHIGGLMDPEEDVLVLYLTSHGSRHHRLAVDFWPLALNNLDPDRLKRALDDAGIKWKVIIISACFSGGFIDKLRDEHTLVMTSAEAKRESFGCGTGSDFTYFGQALFDVELRHTRSIVEAFAGAARRIGEREERERRTPSQPQMAVSAPMAQKLAALARELDRRVPAAPATGVAASPRPSGDAACGRKDC
jgi:hypothetical protein